MATTTMVPNMKLVRQSATKGTLSGALPPSSSDVAKLIDVSKCIGCKACQSACLEWNDQIEPVGFNNGTYDNPHDLTENSFTVMRFTEWDNPTCVALHQSPRPPREPDERNLDTGRSHLGDDGLVRTNDDPFKHILR